MFSGIITVVLLSSVAVSLSLLPFFKWFRETPHQMAAIKELEDSIADKALLEEEAEWFQTWKTSGIHSRGLWRSVLQPARQPYWLRSA